ncbi:MAG: hypothetical protein A2622_05255 [Bdellovibrionales bacterium RIFCSPHIGHO2_01_FULL_40_29]|nr:MAG: hypothetical protein A2622_05255 [Bdellovibrionales bacterium RIFCSPHIGHO2_01_FULL_40_29]OFZ34668.1 MAG: hypothetical protein A3D17_10120 [Bdellovibrionales bacterium RIFCSPHIGHO2_02_FULL_40_15]
MLIQSWLSKFFRPHRTAKSPAWSGLFLFSVFILISGCDFFSNRVLNKTVVEVGPHRMTIQEFSKQLAAKLKNLDALSAKDPAILSKFKAKIISDFVVESLILIWFQEQKLTLTSEEVNAELKSLQSGYPDDKSFRLILSEESMAYSQWRKQIEQNLKRKKAFAHMNQNVTPPTEDELLSYFNNNKERYRQKEAVKLSHVLVLDENQAEIVKKLSRSQKFSEVIKKFSMSPDSAFGGEYGWVERDANDDLEKLFKMRAGEVSAPIKMPDGYHIFRIESRRGERQKTFNEVREQAKNDVIALRQTAKFSAWLDEQIKKYKVFKNVQALDSLYVETQDGSAQK